MGRITHIRGTTLATITPGTLQDLNNAVLDGDLKDLELSKLGDPTYKTLDDLFSLLMSSGLLDGSTFSIVSSDTVRVSAGSGLIRAVDDPTSALYACSWDQADVVLGSDEVVYVGVEYNSGSPQIVTKSTDTWDYNTEFPLGFCYTQAGNLRYIRVPQLIRDHISNISNLISNVFGIKRDEAAGGLILGETGSRNITVTEGALWVRLNRKTFPAFDSSDSDSFDDNYRTGAGTWAHNHGITQWDNLNYDGGSGLVALAAGKYGVLWFYVGLDRDVECVYGRGEYDTLILAEDEHPPATLPEAVSKDAVLIGRLIFQQGASSAEKIDSVFSTVFAPTVITSHSLLSNLSANDHTQYQLRTEKNAASGYAGLSASSKLTGTQQVYGSASNTACEGNDSRLSDARTPAGSAGGQLGGTYPNPDVRGLRETSGPTELAVGGIADGQVLSRSGTSVVGTTIIKELNFDFQKKDDFNTYRTLKCGSSSTIRNSFVFPVDLNVIHSLDAIAITVGGGTSKDIDIYSEYGAVGESYSFHAESDTTLLYNLGSAGDIFTIDLLPIFSAASAGDVAGLEIVHNGVGSDTHYLGVRLRYS